MSKKIPAGVQHAADNALREAQSIGIADFGGEVRLVGDHSVSTSVDAVNERFVQVWEDANGRRITLNRTAGTRRDGSAVSDLEYVVERAYVPLARDENWLPLWAYPIALGLVLGGILFIVVMTWKP